MLVAKKDLRNQHWYEQGTFVFLYVNNKDSYYAINIFTKKEKFDLSIPSEIKEFVKVSKEGMFSILKQVAIIKKVWDVPLTYSPLSPVSLLPGFSDTSNILWSRFGKVFENGEWADAAVKDKEEILLDAKWYRKKGSLTTFMYYLEEEEEGERTTINYDTITQDTYCYNASHWVLAEEAEIESAVKAVLIKKGLWNEIIEPAVGSSLCLSPYFSFRVDGLDFITPYGLAYSNGKWATKTELKLKESYTYMIHGEKRVFIGISPNSSIGGFSDINNTNVLHFYIDKEFNDLIAIEDVPKEEQEQEIKQTGLRTRKKLF